MGNLIWFDFLSINWGGGKWIFDLEVYVNRVKFSYEKLILLNPTKLMFFPLRVYKDKPACRWELCTQISFKNNHI